MGSNEVIIDGVNVAGCEFFQSEYLEDNSVFCEFCTLWYNACLNNPDCYFKQLQWAKAENEKLKEKIDSCNDEFGCEEMVKYRKALEEVRELGEKTGSMKLIEIVNEVLK